MNSDSWNETLELLMESSEQLDHAFKAPDHLKSDIEWELRGPEYIDLKVSYIYNESSDTLVLMASAEADDKVLYPDRAQRVYHVDLPGECGKDDIEAIYEGWAETLRDNLPVRLFEKDPPGLST